MDAIADRLFFTVISVTDELNAFKVFETLNARGVRLSSTDLLKDFLFSVVNGAGGHEHEIRTTSARDRQVARYILFEIERHVANQAFDYVSDKYTIEHILPEHPDEDWTTFTDEQADRCVYRIGNLTPLEATANRDIGNRSYEEKKGTYAQSGFGITRRVASDHSEWTAGRIAARQQWLANQATAISRLSELS